MSNLDMYIKEAEEQKFQAEINEFLIEFQRRALPLCETIIRDRRMITENELSLGEIDTLFNRAAQVKSGNVVSGTLASKKDALSKKAAKLSDTFKDLSAKASNSAVVQAASNGNKKAAATLQNTVKGAASSAKSAVQKVPGGDKLVAMTDNIESWALDNPKKAAFAAGALKAAAAAAAGAAGGPAAGMILKLAMSMAEKGEDFTGSDFAKSAALGATIGAAGEMGADQIKDLVKDVKMPKLDLSAFISNSEPTNDIGADSNTGQVNTPDTLNTPNTPDNTPINDTPSAPVQPAKIPTSVNVDIENAASDPSATGSVDVDINAATPEIEKEPYDPEFTEFFKWSMEQDLRANSTVSINGSIIPYEQQMAMALDSTGVNQDEFIKGMAQSGMTKDQMATEYRKWIQDGINEYLGLGKPSTVTDSIEILPLSPKLFESDVLTADEIEQAWIKAGKPSDEKSLKAFLAKDFGFDKPELRKVFKSSARAETKSLNDLLAYIKKNDLNDLALGMMDDMGVKQSMMRRAVEGADLNEATEELADRDIADIFDELVKKFGPPSELEPDEDEESNLEKSTTTTQESVIMWSNIVQDYAKAEKLIAVNEAINFLSNAYGLNKWDYIHRNVTSLLHNRRSVMVESINDGRVMEPELFVVCNQLLKECDLNWNDYLTRPEKIAGYFKFKPVIFQKRSLLEKNMGRKKM